MSPIVLIGFTSLKRLLSLLLSLTLLVVSASAFSQQKRVALLIGNSDYKVGRLIRPATDVAELEAALKAINFDDVRVARDLDQNQLRRAIRDFGAMSQGASIALIYYSGHGAQSRGENYLIPIGATIERDADYDVEAVSANAILRQISDAGPRAAIVILDACRDNPVAISRGGVKGLARMEAPTRTMIAFATAPNRTAADSGAYANILSTQIRRRGVELLDVFRNTTDEVLRATNGQQEPRISEISITDRIYLAGNAPEINIATSQAKSIPVDTSPLIIRVGHVGATSGTIAHLGKDNEYGALLAIEDLNAKGVQIGGRRATFELVAKDDAGDPKVGNVVARELIGARPSVVVGHLNSGTSIPASMLYAQAGIPQISPSATNPKLTRQGIRSVFRIVVDDAKLGVALGRYAVQQLHAKTISVVDDRSAYGAGLADMFIAGVKSAGGSIASTSFTTDKSIDFNGVILDLKKASPDLVFYGGMDAQAGPLYKQMIRNGVKAKMMGGDGICSSDFPKLAAVALDPGDIYCAEAGGVEAPLQVGMDRFNDRFKRRFGVNVQAYAPYVYDAVNVAVAAMVSSGSSEPERYLPFLSNIKYSGITGPIAFDSRGDITGGAYSMYTFSAANRKQVGVFRTSE